MLIVTLPTNTVSLFTNTQPFVCSDEVYDLVFVDAASESRISFDEVFYHAEA